MLLQASKTLEIFLSTATKARQLRRQVRNEPTISLIEKHQSMQSWAKETLRTIGVEVHQEGEPPTVPAIYVGNHVSYLDIPLLMSVSPVVFVAKKELETWPIFGSAMKTVGTIFVERESKESRKRITSTLAPHLLEKQQSIVIFPSGTTTMNEEKPWRWGAFQLAKDLSIPIVPFRLDYEPKRAAAYLMEDSFGPHLWALLGSRKISARIEIHKPVHVSDPRVSATTWQDWVRNNQ